MTYSVLAVDPETGDVGGAAATGNLAVGAWVLRASPEGGAVATQGASCSPVWGDEGLARLGRGEDARAVLDDLTRRDGGRGHRQLSLLGLDGRAAAFTGEANHDHKGQRLGDGWVIAGNWLAGPQVLDAMEGAWLTAAPEAEFGRRLLATLRAGYEAGGDSRGAFSAAIRIVGRRRAPMDLRVDYDEKPVHRLIALYDMASRPPYSEWADRIPTLEEPERC